MDYAWHSKTKSKRTARSSQKKQQHENSLFAPTKTTTVTLISYQCKKQRSVVIMSTIHFDVEISSDNNLKKKSETVLFHNKTKAGVDVIDQMTRNTL